MITTSERLQPAMAINANNESYVCGSFFFQKMNHTRYNNKNNNHTDYNHNDVYTDRLTMIYTFERACGVPVKKNLMNMV